MTNFLYLDNFRIRPILQVSQKQLVLTLLSLILITKLNYCYSQDCNCPDYEFSSSEHKPLIEIGTENNRLLVCGYSDFYPDNGIRIGTMLKDSSIYLSGFNIFYCTDSMCPLLSEGEAQLFKLKPSKEFLTMDLMMDLPVDKGLKYTSTSVIEYRIFKQNENWTVGKPIINLNFGSLSEEDFFKIKKDLGWDKLYPEKIFARDEDYEGNKITYAFILSLKEFPKHNKAFADLKTDDTDLMEYHDQMVQILMDLK